VSKAVRDVEMQASSAGRAVPCRSDWLSVVLGQFMGIAQKLPLSTDPQALREEAVDRLEKSGGDTELLTDTVLERADADARSRGADRAVAKDLVTAVLALTGHETDDEGESVVDDTPDDAVSDDSTLEESQSTPESTPVPIVDTKELEVDYSSLFVVEVVSGPMDGAWFGVDDSQFTIGSGTEADICLAYDAALETEVVCRAEVDGDSLVVSGDGVEVIEAESLSPGAVGRPSAVVRVGETQLLVMTGSGSGEAAPDDEAGKGGSPARGNGDTPSEGPATDLDSCPECDAPHESDEKWCPHCDHEFDVSAPEGSEAREETPAPETESVGSPQPPDDESGRRVCQNPDCGHENEPDAQWCAKCGLDL
jgi:hypothetical protein